MWKNLSRLTTHVNLLKLSPESCLQQQIRTTFVLKRRYNPPLTAKGKTRRPLRSRYFVYDLVEDTNVVKQEKMAVILTGYVKGIGDAGDKVSVSPNVAYNDLLLPGLAVYPTAENLEKYKDINTKEVQLYSSRTAKLMLDSLSRILLSVVMNMETPWTLQPWHIKASFRKSSYWIPEECITMPPNVIKGPNMDLEGKLFYVTVTINKKEKVDVVCRLHHWSSNIMQRLPHQRDFFKLPANPIFPDEKEKFDYLRNRKEYD